MEYKPWPYQARVIDEIKNKPRVGLFLDMGLGKTVCTLTALNDLMFDSFEVYKTLIIAPLRVAEDTWSGEVEKWNHLKDLRVSKVLGNEKKRLEALNTEADIYVINNENVVWLVNKLKKWPFDCVVIDELSRFKSSKSQRFRALKRVISGASRVIGLTGTPSSNGLMDLWAQIYLLDRGERLGKTITRYRQEYFYAGASNGYVVYQYVPRKGAKDEIYSKIKDICISMKSEDYLKMPKKINNVIKVSLSDKERKLYDKLEKELVLDFDDQELSAASAATLSQKLLQLANGAAYTDEGGVVKIHDKKLDALADILEDTDKPVLVFYNYKHDYDRLCERFNDLQPQTIKGSADIKAWNDGKIRLLLCHPASVGHGLNIQRGGNTIVWFGLTWSLELYQQANARLYRQGQKENSVIIHHLVAKGTIDERVMKALNDKDVGQKALMDAVKAVLDRR